MPAQPTASIDIVNLALDRLGQAAANSIDTPQSSTEEVMARQYPQTRRELLREFIFNFARKPAVLTASGTEVPAFGYSTAYLLPTGFIRLLALGDITINNDTPPDFYDLSNGFIYTDTTDGDSGDLNILYIFDAQTVSKYDPLFIKLLYLKLAKNTAYKFTLKPGLVKQIDEEYEEAAVRAAAVAGQEKPPRRVERSKWLAARRSSGARDNSRIW
jgi:hypothetical protein